MIDLQLILELGGTILGNINPDSITDVHNFYQEITPGSLFVVIKGMNTDGANFIPNAIKKGAVAILTSKKIDIDIPQIIVDDVVLFLSRYAAKNRQNFKKPVIAVVGSVGKTTLRHVLSVLLPGKKLYTRKSFNIKFSISMALMLLDNSYDYAIIEIGTNFPGEVSDLARIVQPDYSLISDLCIEHTEFLKDIKGVINEEYSIVNYTKKAVISSNKNKKLLEDNHLLHLTNKNSIHYFLPEFTRHENEITININNINIDFQCNVKGIGIINAIIFILFLGSLLNLDTLEMAQNAQFLHNVGHRGNLIKIGNLKIYDYAYNCNPESRQNLLNNITEPCILVFSEMKELGECSSVEHLKALEQINNHELIKKAYIVGNSEIPEIFKDKIDCLTDDIINNFKNYTDTLYIQGARSMKLENIIYKIIDQFM